MFHEYREEVTKLKTTNAHFKKIFEAHNDLHDQIEKAELSGNDHINPVEIERMKVIMSLKYFFKMCICCF
jgi:uncharacterized protein YdcH (DUF465 family)